MTGSAITFWVKCLIVIGWVVAVGGCTDDAPKSKGRHVDEHATLCFLRAFHAFLMDYRNEHGRFPDSADQVESWLRSDAWHVGAFRSCSKYRDPVTGEWLNWIMRRDTSTLTASDVLVVSAAIQGPRSSYRYQVCVDGAVAVVTVED